MENKIILSDGKFVTAGGGSNYNATEEYIPVVAGVNYITNVNASGPMYHAFYSDKNEASFISSFQAKKFLVPNNAKYVRLSGYGYPTGYVSCDINLRQYVLSVIDSKIAVLQSEVKAQANSIENLREDVDSILTNKIVCWGDSLTQGAGADRLTNLSAVLSVLTDRGFDVTGLSSGAPWPTVLQTLIGNSVSVQNNGIGGENLKDICCRIGVNPLVVNTGFTLPANAGTKVNVLTSELDFAWGGHPTFTDQAGRYNPIFIDDIECSFSKHDSTSYDFTRVENGVARDIKIGDTISFRGVTLRTPKAVIFFMGANGGYSDVDDLVAKFKKAITAVGSPNYLCIYNYAWDTASVTNTKERNAAMLAEFGSNFIDLQTYLSSHALEDFGITPTTDADLTSEQIANGVQSDVTLMAAGALPSSLWRNCYGVDGATSNDKHLNAAGYAIVGYKIYERMKILNII